MVDETRDGKRHARTHTHISQAGHGTFRTAEKRWDDDDVTNKTSGRRSGSKMIGNNNKWSNNNSVLSTL
jgi:hypothetical protein